MSELQDPSNPRGQTGQAPKAAVQHAANAVQDGVRSAEKSAGQALDKLSGKADEVRQQAAPVVEGLSRQAQDLMDQGRRVFHDASDKAREKAVAASDFAVGYAKEEPMKAVLIAAAVGALLMGLVTMTARSRD